MSNFTTRQGIPTTEEYLNEPLESLLDRQHRNPNGQQSEDTFISSVIAVRSAKIHEKLGTRLNWLSLVIAAATVLLVVVPFFAPKFQAKMLSAALKRQSVLQEKSEREIQELKTELTHLKTKIAVLSELIEASNTQESANKVRITNPFHPD